MRKTGKLPTASLMQTLRLQVALGWRVDTHIAVAQAIILESGGCAFLVCHNLVKEGAEAERNSTLVETGVPNHAHWPIATTHTPLSGVVYPELRNSVSESKTAGPWLRPALHPCLSRGPSGHWTCCYVML